MKRLGILAFIVAFSLSIFGGFSTIKKVFAEDTYDSISSQVIADIDATQKKFDAKKNDIDARAAAGTVSLKDAKQYEYNYSKYTSVLNNTKSAYISVVDASKKANMPTYEGQAKAVSMANNILGTEESRISAVLNSEHRRIFSQLSSEFNLKYDLYRKQASGINIDPDGVLTASSTDRLQNVSPDTVKTPVIEGQVTKNLCAFFSWSLGDCINEGVTWLIKNTLLQIAGFLVWLTANMFNYAVQIGILQFSDWAPTTLYPIWILIRQIVSLVVVFAVLYLGGLFMLGDENGKFEKIIPWLVMFALFVNFSYPLARTAVDISNIISLKVYASAVGNDALTKDSKVSFNSNNAGSLIMDKLGLQGLVTSATSDGSAATGLLGATVNSIPGALLAVVFVLYTAYIFFIVTLLMIVRTVSLVFIIVASPLLLVDSVIPLLGEQAKKLRQIFIDQLLVGPIFMIMFALTIRFLDIFSIRGKGTINGLGTGLSDGNSIVIFFNLLMMLIMLHVMLTVTKETSGKLGAWGSGILGTVGGFGVGTAFAGAGLLARQTVGRGALALQNTEWVKNNKDGALGRAVHKSTSAVANSSLNVMKSGVVAGAMKNLGMSTGMGMGIGMGAQGGYVSSQKRRESYDKEAREAMQLRHKESFTDKETGVFHRKGDVDKEATQEAKRRFDENRGKSLFATKEQSQAISDRIAKEEDEKIMKAYNELKTPKERKDKLEEYTRELEKMNLKDPNLKDPRTQVLANFVATITKKEKTEEEAFAQELDEVIFAYKAKSGNPADQAKYLTSKSKKIQEAFAKREREGLITPSPSGSPVDVDTEAPTFIDLVEPRREQVAAASQASTSSSSVTTSSSTPSNPILVQTGPQQSTNTNTSPTTTVTSPAFDVMSSNVAEAARAKRKAAQKANQGSMDRGGDGGAAPQTTSTSPKVPSDPPLTATV